MIVKDSMVLIHLAKITLLEKSCDYFKDVIIPEKVYNETVSMEEKYEESVLIKELCEDGKIKVKKMINTILVNKANQYNIQRGEAEAVALYWQENADFIATDDDNVRKKRLLLNLNIIGTPSILLRLYTTNKIRKEKFKEAVDELRKIGWFSSALLDKVLMEGLK